jgi:peroxiredoxin
MRSARRTHFEEPEAMASLVNFVALACLFSSSALLAAGGAGDGGLDAISERPPAPAFELADPGGEQVRLADYRGKPLIVNFWATWCPPCRAEMPSLQRAWEQVRGDGIELVAINVGESESTIQRFLEQVPISFPLPMDRDSKVVQEWPIRGLPTTFVVDPEGRLAYKAAGEREWDNADLLDLVRGLKAPR